MTKLLHLQAVPLGAIAIAMMACSSVPQRSAARPAAACVIGAGQPKSDDTVVVATTAGVDWAHVPMPTNNGERLAFTQLYETLIAVDCDGQPQPALAASWTLDATKTRITVSIRPGAMFWSGKPITAEDILAAWRRTAAQSPSGDLAREILTGTTIIDDRTILVSLPDTGWLVLSSPRLAVYEQQATALWPEGSGPYRIAEQSAQGGFLLMPIASQSAPYLRSRPVPTRDTRDAIDAGSDVLITDDPIAVSYASTRTNLAAIPLPWTRTYALALPVAESRIAVAWQRPDLDLAAARASLARDAVHADARSAQPPYWWQGGLACGGTSDSLAVSRTTVLRSNRVVYVRDDRVARGLAERLVAIEPRTVAVGLAPNDFARSLRESGDVAYVLDLPRLSMSSCRDFRELRSRAPWLASAADADSKLVPLIDTRETAILNRQRVAATVDWSGALHFARP